MTSQCNPLAGGGMTNNPGPCGPAPCGGECAPEVEEVEEQECRQCGGSIRGWDDWATEAGFCDTACQREAWQDAADDARYEAYRDSRYDD